MSGGQDLFVEGIVRLAQWLHSHDIAYEHGGVQIKIVAAHSKVSRDIEAALKRDFAVPGVSDGKPHHPFPKPDQVCGLWFRIDNNWHEKRKV